MPSRLLLLLFCGCIFALMKTCYLTYAFPILLLFLSLFSFLSSRDFKSLLPFQVVTNRELDSECTVKTQQWESRWLGSQYGSGLSKGPTEAGRRLLPHLWFARTVLSPALTWVAICSTAASIFVTGPAHCHLCFSCHSHTAAKTAWIPLPEILLVASCSK